MNKLFTQLVRSDIGLELSDVRVTKDEFSVKTRAGGPKIIFGLLFGVPGIFLLLMAIVSLDLIAIVGAVLFSPVLIFVGLLFGVSISEKVFNKTTLTFVSRLTVLGFTKEEVLPLPRASLVIKSENRGSTKTGSGSFIRYSVHVPDTAGCGFALSRDYFKMRAFAEQLASFLSVSIDDTVEEVNRITR